MQRMCSRLWSPAARFHPGQLAWSRYYAPVDPVRLGAEEAIAIWSDAADGVLGFAWAEAPDWLEVQIDSHHPEASALAEEVFDWFEEWSDADEQSVLLMESDADGPLGRACAAAGFVPHPDGMFFTHHLIDLDDLPPVPPVDGYTFRSVRPHEARERAACHAAAWSDVSPSKVTEASYRQLMAAPPYRHDLDWVAVSMGGPDDGAMIASALIWLDPTLGIGLVEPVGCAPAHRGKGLAGAVTLAGLHALRQVGGIRGLVSPRGDDDYPGPRKLYQSLGFAPQARTVTWTRSLG